MPEKTKTVICPCCKKDSLYTPANPHRPFCSDRCRQIDLGAWANESFRVPDNSTPVDEWGDSPQLH